MGYFTLKFAVVAAIFLIAAVSLPLGAIAAHKRARKNAGKRARAALTPKRIALRLLREERLDREIVTEPCLDPDSCGYDGYKLRLRVTDTGGDDATVAELAEVAFGVARATLHADADKDFSANEARATPVAILANALPVAATLGLVLPEARGLLFVVTPATAVILAGYALLSIPAERRAAERATVLLKKHHLLSEEEFSLAATYLRARASLALARPLRACFWISPLL